MSAVLENFRSERKRKMDKDARYILTSLHCPIIFTFLSFDDRKKKRKTMAKKVSDETAFSVTS